MTLRFFYFLSIFSSGIFGLLLSFVNGEFDYLGLLFFGFFCAFSVIFSIFEIKTYKIKPFWSNQQDEFYFQLTPEYFIYRLNDNEIKLAWHNIVDFSYIRGGLNNQNHIMITQRNGNIIRIFKSQTTLNIKELEKPLTTYFRKCRTFNADHQSVSLFGFKL